MNPTNKKAPAVHPEIKCLIQPLAVKDLSHFVVLFPDAESGVTIDAWNGYLLCDPGIYKLCSSSNLLETSDNAFSIAVLNVSLDSPTFNSIASV